MNIIRADLSHLDLLLPLFSAYRRFYQQAPDLTAEKRFLADRLRSGESVVFLATEEPDRALGFVQLYPSFDSVALIATWILHDLFVDQQHRKHGAGRELMNAAAQFCRARGAERIDLATAITNTSAQPLYESLGYERDREFYHYSLAIAASRGSSG